MVDEDTDTDALFELAKRGFDAVTVGDALGRGFSDPSVTAFARSECRVPGTTDRDFLDPALHDGICVFVVADDGATG